MKFLIIAIIVVAILLGMNSCGQQEWQKNAMPETWYDGHPEETAQLLAYCDKQEATVEACTAVKRFKENNLSVQEVYQIYRKAKQNFDQKNYQVAMKYYLKAAKHNNFDAVNDIGYMYSNGLGVEQDEQKAFQWFLKAAKLGNPMSMYSLGRCYYYGRGTPRDISKAKEWLSKSANKGYVDAKTFLDKI